jgi:hypothetical protein
MRSVGITQGPSHEVNKKEGRTGGRNSKNLVLTEWEIFGKNYKPIQKKKDKEQK